MPVSISDLPHDALIEVFSRLPPEQVLRLATVNRFWCCCVRKALRSQVVAISFGQPNPVCCHLNDKKRVFVVDISRFFVNDKEAKKRRKTLSNENIDSICKLIDWCGPIKCLDLTRLDINGIDNLIKIINKCEKLECLIVNWINVRHTKWQQLINLLSDKLIHFVCFNSAMKKQVLNMLLDSLRNLEFFYLQVNIWTNYFQYVEDMDGFLKLLANRKAKITVKLVDDYLETEKLLQIIDSDINYLEIESRLGSFPKHIKEFRQINKLNLSGVYYPSNDVFSWKFSALNELTIERMSRVICRVFAKSDISQVKVLNLVSLNNHISRQRMDDFFKLLTGLIRLRINVDDHDVRNMFALQSLKQLKIDEFELQSKKCLTQINWLINLINFFRNEINVKRLLITAEFKKTDVLDLDEEIPNVINLLANYRSAKPRGVMKIELSFKSEDPIKQRLSEWQNVIYCREASHWLRIKEVFDNKKFRVTLETI